MEGAYADINVIDFENLSLSGPEYVHDFPGGAGMHIKEEAVMTQQSSTAASLWKMVNTPVNSLESLFGQPTD